MENRKIIAKNQWNLKLVQWEKAITLINLYPDGSEKERNYKLITLIMKEATSPQIL